jgi:hypothetical protein
VGCLAISGVLHAAAASESCRAAARAAGMVSCNSSYSPCSIKCARTLNTPRAPL